MNTELFWATAQPAILPSLPRRLKPSLILGAISLGLGCKQSFTQRVLRSENHKDFQRFTLNEDCWAQQHKEEVLPCHVCWWSPCCVAEPWSVPVPGPVPSPQPPDAAHDALLERGVPETHRSLVQGQQRVPHHALQVTQQLPTWPHPNGIQRSLCA